MMAHDLLLLLPEIVVLLTAIGALIFEMLLNPRGAFVVTIVGLGIAASLSLRLIGMDTTIFGGTLRVDDLSVWAQLILLPSTALSVLLARYELRGTDREGTVYSLLCFATLGALLLAGMGDIMVLVLGILLSALAAFALVAYPRNHTATEAAMKFFVFASVTSSVMIFGLTYWYGAMGSTLLYELRYLDKIPLAGTVGLIAVLVGLGYKASLVPFHFWTPDAYEGAPLSVAAYLSVVPKIGAIFALAQIVRNLPTTTAWPSLIAVLCVLTMTYGNLAALVQQNMVRLLAYSSIAQSGYFLLGLVGVGVSPLALKSLIVYAAAYAAMNLGAFAIIAATGRHLDNFKSLGRVRPALGIVMTVFLLSLAGIPPLAGFMGKFLLLGAAMDAGFTWLAVIGIINSILSLAVYLRIVVNMYRQQHTPPKEITFLAIISPQPWVTAVWSIAFIATLSIGFGAQMLLEN